VLDAKLKALRSGMNAALAVGDKTAAMSYLSPAAQEKYGPVFDLLGPNMAESIASLSFPSGLDIQNQIAEYGINRTIDGVNRIFLVYFLRGADGVWRLDSM
jgi:hypothetical protein